MRNRAKCKLCNQIIESFLRHDYVACNCGEIAVDGGSYYFKCSAKNPDNFIRLDDNGHEIITKWCDKEDMITEETLIPDYPAIKKELLDMLDAIVKRYEDLPLSAQSSPVTVADLSNVVSLISSILRA